MRAARVEGFHPSETMNLCLDAVKEIYEAVVIWAFLKLMFAYTGVRLGQPVWLSTNVRVS
jgi:hypothetical protein